MKANVITQFNADIIKQHVEYSDEFQSLRYNMVEEVIKLKEQGVIDALIALGWTPPNEDKS